MKTYELRINTIDNLYADYLVEADNINEAKYKVKRAFFKDYPEADENLKISFSNISSSIISEIIDIIKEENKCQ